MPEQRSPLKEFRHLEEKLKTVGLSPAERKRYDQLGASLSSGAQAKRAGFDVNAAADAIRASLDAGGAPRPRAARVSPLDLPRERPAGGGAGAPAGLDPGPGSLEEASDSDEGAPAWDAAGLPPEPGPGGYDRGPWDEASAEPTPAEAAPTEVGEEDFVEAEPGEGEAAPPPVDWPGSDAGPAPAEETYQALDEEGFEPAPVGGPGIFPAEEAPALDSFPVPDLAPPGTPAEPPAAAADSLDLDVDVEEPVEEVIEVPEPPAPVPAAPAPPRDVGGQAPSFVLGEHRVVVHTLEGQVLRGTIADVDLDAPSLPLVTAAGGAPQPIAASRVKAIFFMLLPGGKPPAPEGRRVRVTFRDGRQVAGYSPDYQPEAVGFFMVPADTRTNTGRIWVYREAVKQVSVS